MATTEQQPVGQLRVPRIRIRISGFILTIQTVLFFAHLFVYETCVFFWPDLSLRQIAVLRIVALLLSVSFVAASLLAYKHWNIWVRMFYRAAAVWMGFLNFFFLASIACWVVYLASCTFAANLARPDIALAAFGLLTLVGLYALLNARSTRVPRVSVTLPNLPAPWRGRVAALVTDVHLGHVNSQGFMRRVVGKLARLKPDIVFICGDLFDGTHADLESLAEPWKELTAQFGAYFVTGNHEEFSDRGKYLRAVAGSGVRVLNNEKITVDDLQIVGVHDGDSHDPERYRGILESTGIERGRASVLLLHVPRSLAIAEQAGISLQLSGHTHGGQFFPFTWFTRRIFRQYTYGLNRFANLLVLTSYGVGTWGPPFRVGTTPEIVLIKFE
jgi:uncharacterized protein